MPALAYIPAHPATPPRGVALVLHGLNVRPARMIPLATCLAAAGVECLCLSLRGHGDNYLRPPTQTRRQDQQERDDAAARLESFRRVSYALWRDETAAAYAIARARSDQLGAPLLLAGFSLGAALGCTLAVTQPGVRFERMILLAPALALRRNSCLPLLLAHWPRAVIPSLAPAKYRANRGTPIAAYSALDRALALFAGGDRRRLDMPTLLLADPQDELVSYAGLQRLAAQQPQWTLRPIVKSGYATAYPVHHLLIDAEAVGASTWADICAHVTAFVQPSPTSGQIQ